MAISSSVDVSRVVLSNSAGRERGLWGVTDALPLGHPRLVRQIARRYLENGMSVDPNEIIVTVGATEAINLCLQAVAKPDVIAVESPTFYAVLHAIERMGMKAIEVATLPEYGIDIAALAAIVKSQPITGCMVIKPDRRVPHRLGVAGPLS